MTFAFTAAAAKSPPVPVPFSYTHKPAQTLRPSGEELVLAEHYAKGLGSHRSSEDSFNVDEDVVHAVTLSWFTGELNWPTFSATLIRYYVDGETTASVELTIDELTGAYFNSSDHTHMSKILPWGNFRIGRTAIGGGAYSTVAIPFRQSIRITAAADSTMERPRSFFSKIAGVENYGPVRLPISGLQLPPTARLRSQRRIVKLAPAEWATLGFFNRSVFNTSWGTLLYTWQRIQSSSAFCLEGIHEVFIDGATVPMQLSSGFEDYYLSGQYFDAGEFASPLSGMTSESSYLYPHAVTAFRFHDADPLPFERSISLRWRNGMYTNGTLAANETLLRSALLAYV